MNRSVEKMQDTSNNTHYAADNYMDYVSVIMQ
jgi:hypothetical protein